MVNPPSLYRSNYPQRNRPYTVYIVKFWLWVCKEMKPKRLFNRKERKRFTMKGEK